MAVGAIAAPGAPAAAAAKAPGVGFNKMFVMVPVMLAARKLDAEDPKIVHYLRIAYGSMQTICVLVVLYTYMKASSKSSSDGSKLFMYQRLLRYVKNKNSILYGGRGEKKKKLRKEMDVM